MKHYIGGTNDGGCLNYGYRRLNSHGSHVWISSGAGGYGYGYNNYERCYWAIYAPGAQRLELRLSSFNVGFSTIIFKGQIMNLLVISDILSRLPLYEVRCRVWWVLCSCCIWRTI